MTVNPCWTIGKTMPCSATDGPGESDLTLDPQFPAWIKYQTRLTSTRRVFPPEARCTDVLVSFPSEPNNEPPELEVPFPPFPQMAFGYNQQSRSNTTGASLHLSHWHCQLAEGLLAVRLLEFTTPGRTQTGTPAGCSRRPSSGDLAIQPSPNRPRAAAALLV